MTENQILTSVVECLACNHFCFGYPLNAKLLIIGIAGLVILKVIITLGLNKLALLGYFLLKILILSFGSSWFNRYRNTYEHNLCLDMLKEGFHQSFRELFNVMKKQKADVARLGTDSGLSDQPLLENEPAKLDQLKHHLTTAEAAKRRGEKINSILSIWYSGNHCLVRSVGLGWSADTGSYRLKPNIRGLEGKE